MDYHDALLRDIRALRFAEQLLANEMRRRASGDWRHLIDIAGCAAGTALARLGGLGAAW